MVNPDEVDLNESLKMVAVESGLELFISTLANCKELSKIQIDNYFTGAEEFFKENPHFAKNRSLFEKKGLLAKRAYDKVREIAAIYDEIGEVETKIRENNDDAS